MSKCGRGGRWVDVRPNWAEAPSSPANWEARRAMPDILAASLSPASQRGAVSCRPGRNGRSCLGSARQPTRQGVPMDTPSPSPGSASNALSLSCWAANPFGVSGALLVAAGAQRQGAARDCSLRNTGPQSCTNHEARITIYRLARVIGPCPQRRKAPNRANWAGVGAFPFLSDQPVQTDPGSKPWNPSMTLGRRWTWKTCVGKAVQECRAEDRHT